MPVPRSLLSRDGVPDLDLALVSGHWPDDLGGEVFLSTSDMATATRHAFFGDGVMIRLSLHPGTFGAPEGRFAWRSRVLDTPTRRLREKRPDVFESGATGPTSPFGYGNCVNTVPLPWGDRLFATWDAGRPVEVDPVSLEFLGEVGQRDDWMVALDAPVLPLIVSSAHPVVDPDRDCLWTVALNPLDGSTQLVRYGGHGSRVDHWRVADATVPQSMHTLTQTRDWLVLVDTAFRADPNEILGIGERSITNFQDEPVYLVRKAAVEATPTGGEVEATAFRIGPEVMHYYARYDDSDGIEVIFEHTVDVDLAIHLRADDTDALGRPVDPALAGLYNHPMSPGRVGILRFDPETGDVTERASLVEADRFWTTQLSALDWSTEGMSRPTVHHQLFTGYRPEAVVGRALDLYRDRVDRDELPREEKPGVLATLDRVRRNPRGVEYRTLADYPTSPCFVPRGPGSEPRHSRYAGSDPGGHDGYLVQPVQNDASFRIEVFDAADVGRGPVAVLADPGGATVPFLIHSAWMPRARPAPDVERLTFADEPRRARGPRGLSWTDLAWPRPGRWRASSGPADRPPGRRPSGRVSEPGVGAEELGDGLAVEGAREMKPLGQVTAHLPQRGELRIGFDALGHRLEPEGVREVHDRRDDRGVTVVVAEAPHERPVDLQHVHRELAEIAQRRVARPEVVDDEVDAQVPQSSQCLVGHLDVVHQHALGDLQLHPVGAGCRSRRGSRAHPRRARDVPAGDPRG
ncbi:MAG: carotenoid oxygenase family protein [Acidimicrobiia bacterium]|nr:carotenoid oxygenase family protein [Acidimicrobiia bacterium]